VTLITRAGWWRGLAGLTRSGRAEEGLSWALYDFANTIFSYGVVSYAIGLWSVDRLGEGDGQLWLGVATALSVGLNAAVSPVLGAMSDRTGRRLCYVLFFTSLTIIATAFIGLVTLDTGLPWLALIGLGLFSIANFSYQAERGAAFDPGEVTRAITSALAWPLQRVATPG